MMMDVQVPCRKCGKKAPSSEFTIDPDLKMAICKACANERKIAKSSPGFNPSVRNVPHEIPKSEPRPAVLNHPAVLNQQTIPSKTVSSQSSSQSGLGINFKSNTPPAGWDETDELIEKAANTKTMSKSDTGNAELEDGRIMHACKKCKYQFKYDPEDNRPNKCPYCGTAVKDAFRN
jgi:hypothetical protein